MAGRSGRNVGICTNWARDPYPTLKRGKEEDKANIALANAICKDNEARGCTIEDEDALLENQRHAKGTVPCPIDLSRTRFCSLPFTPNS